MPKVVEYLAESDSDILIRPGLLEPISPRSGRRVHGDVWAGPPQSIRVGEGKIVKG